jgi:hypothetical protein
MQIHWDRKYDDGWEGLEGKSEVLLLTVLKVSVWDDEKVLETSQTWWWWLQDSVIVFNALQSNPKMVKIVNFM